MNNERRKAIEAVRTELEAAFEALDSVKSQLEDLQQGEEREYYDNILLAVLEALG